jgi:hypothetical protein
MGDDVGKCLKNEKYPGLWEVPLYQAQLPGTGEVMGVGSESSTAAPAALFSNGCSATQCRSGAATDVPCKSSTSTPPDPVLEVLLTVPPQPVVCC